MNIVTKAKIFATAAHAAVGQRRKYTGEPYIVHPEVVANIVTGTKHATDEAIAAAYLHDVLEDTQVTYELLVEHFGLEVADLVRWLTDVEEGNRKERKAAACARLALAPASAQTIKVADLIHNTLSIMDHDSDFAKVYLKEKRDLLDVLVLADKTLLEMARLQLALYETPQSK